MRTWIKVLPWFFLSVSATVFANDAPAPVQIVSPYPQLNTISYEITLDKWVPTTTARVIVAVDANLNNQSLGDFQQQLPGTLSKLSKNSQWQVTRFDRQEDQSGLERVNAEAEARISASELTNIRNQALAISKPGVKYTVQSIEFTPSLSDIALAQSQLRLDLNKRIQEEINSLDKLYDKDYFLSDVVFLNNGGMEPQPRVYKLAQNTASNFAAPAVPPMSVNQKIVMTAQVTLATPMEKF